MSQKSMNLFLDKIEGKWSPNTPPPDGEVARVVAGLQNPLPDALRTLYERANGGWVNLDIYVFLIDELEEFNSDEDSFTYLPSALFFAMDEGSGIFFINTDGSLGRGVGAVFWCERSAMIPDICKPCADDVVNFLSNVVEGQDPRKGPNLSHLALETMFKQLSSKHNYWHGSPGANSDAISKTKKRCNARIPTVLQELLQYTNGITFTHPSVTLKDTNTIIPIKCSISENGNSPALLIGEDADGNQYGLTILSWSDLPGVRPLWEGRVIRLAPGQPLDRQKFRVSCLMW